jgi:hypothetical protein
MIIAPVAKQFHKNIYKVYKVYIAYNNQMMGYLN